MKTPKKQQKQPVARDITVRFYENEIAAIRDITKVDAVAPGVRAVVLRAIEDRMAKIENK